MARNRQKAKERQARRKSEGQGNGPAPERRRGGEPISDDVADELEREATVASGSEPVTPPPLSESERLRSGAANGDAGSAEEFQSAEDDPEHFDPEVDEPEDVEDLAPGPRGHRGDNDADSAHGSGLVEFFRSVIAELRRVQWPDRQALTTLTGVVLGFVVIAGAFLGLLDAAFQRLVDLLI